MTISEAPNVGERQRLRREFRRKFRNVTVWKDGDYDYDATRQAQVELVLQYHGKSAALLYKLSEYQDISWDEAR